MAYCVVNFRNKKDMKQAVERGQRVEIFQPGGMFPLSPRTGVQYIEGPHYPEPHRWYAKVQVEDAVVVKVLS